MGFLSGLTLLLIAFKIMGVISCSWFWVLSPFWVLPILIVLAILAHVAAEALLALWR